MRVALVYDRVNKWGGAERILLALHQIFPDAPLFTSVYNQKSAPWAKVFNIKTSFLQKFPFASSLHEFYAPLMPIAFESFNFEDFDLVISLTSEAAKGIITKPQTLHICLCLTPTRYLWSGYEDYFKNPLIRFLSKPVVGYLRYWDKIASQRPDIYLAISTEVKNRIKKYYQRTSEIILLPVDSLKEVRDRVNEDYYLIVSRLVYYKRIEIAIKAFNTLGIKLKIVGMGSEEQNLKSIAGENIEFLGNLKDEKLSVYYKSCKGLIFPGREDFGLVMVEAQSFGKPVLAFRGGGAMDIIKEGVTGEFFESQTEESLVTAMEKFINKRYNAKLCIQNAEKFSFDNFNQSLMKVIYTNLQTL
jgi:glycosyltransferase involved in cell wall biosynthesis